MRGSFLTGILDQTNMPLWPIHCRFAVFPHTFGLQGRWYSGNVDVANPEWTRQMATKTVQMPADLLAAIEGDGVLTTEQFRQLFEIEAESIGLTFD